MLVYVSDKLLTNNYDIAIYQWFLEALMHISVFYIIHERFIEPARVLQITTVTYKC